MLNKIKSIFSKRGNFDRFNEPKILIFGWTRTGSSNLGEIVKSVTKSSFIYEPFHAKNGIDIRSIKQLKKELHQIWDQYDGMKHVSRLSKNGDEYLLKHPDHKIIFLWRENISKRVISEFLARQTKIFGSLNDNKSLRQDLEKVTYKPLDLKAFDKNCNKYKQEVDYFKRFLKSNNKKYFEVKFEDLFESNIEAQKEMIQRLCEFLNIPFEDAVFEELKWRFEEKMKQGSDKIYKAIPNLESIQKLIQEKNYGNLFSNNTNSTKEI